MILFSDDFNFKKENFPELYACLEKHGFSFKFDKGHSERKKKWGDYTKYIVNNIESISLNSLDNKSYKGYNIKSIIYMELLYACASTELWRRVENIDENTFWKYIIEYYPHYILGAVNEAKFWIDYWIENINFTKISVGLCFGGSTIYTRAFCEVMKLNNKPVFCMEHFLTGRDFYFELRYQSLPNNTMLQSDLYYKNILINQSSSLKYDDVALKFDNRNNKNVKQPAYTSVIEENYILILAQVSNDFSICSEGNLYKNSISFYKNIIDIILNNSNKDIIIKTHPYEKNKLHKGVSSTYQNLSDFISQKSGSFQKRIKLYEDKSIEGLLDKCDYVITLNSQSGLEALYRNKIVATFGSPFYRNKGFTYDFTDLEEFKENINNIKLKTEHIQNFYKYMSVFFGELIGKGEKEKVFERIKPFIKLNNTVSTSLSNDDRKKNSNKEINNSGAKSINKSKLVGGQPKLTRDISYKNERVKNNVSKNKRLLKKLIKNPKAFLLDSKFGFLRFLGGFFK
ncbi:hypothetical protein OA57_01635 [Chelonobacter oris]|uniref:Capsular biosynthesis protein n=1 Tax=Chelonobacter oris TaxID=505317 RepID=A0A0A3ANP2_9PAST|nr:hypothetical protein [Chelonobacter oris]KGQ70976.1 hypothetical protein OA57_01635 [Chelonobacter oris]